ncbi:11952_t:CDS:2 [Gigaspora rosea]|nr:11952_t:CDS:2 [Gigaspora rosea]
MTDMTIAAPSRRTSGKNFGIREFSKEKERATTEPNKDHQTSQSPISLGALITRAMHFEIIVRYKNLSIT